MRIAGTWMIPIIGGLLLTAAALAQSSDDDEEEQGATSRELGPSSSGEAALAQSLDDEGQGRDYQAPGVHVWVGRHPSKAELQSAITQGRSQAKSLTPSVSDAPDFQNEQVKVWIGRLPKPETLRNMLRSGGGSR
jgi:hypothetical protein